MIDSTGYSQFLTSLAEAELLDWDTSALADWPNIAPTAPATTSIAEPQAGDPCQPD